MPFGVLRGARSKFRVFGGADSTAPPSGRARRRRLAPQQYDLAPAPGIFQALLHYLHNPVPQLEPLLQLTTLELRPDRSH